MKKWMFLIAVAVIAVIAVGVYYFVAPESSEYNGSTDSADCSMNINNDSFKVTYTEYLDNSHLSVRHIYSGKMTGGGFTVDTVVTQYREFGETYRETTETGVSMALSDLVFFREVQGGYLVKETFVKRSVNDAKPELLYVTTEGALKGTGCDITLLKDSSKRDIAEMTVVEIYSDGTVCRYPVDNDRIGDTDLSTIGIKNISVGYGDGKTAVLSIDIVPFIVVKNDIMTRGTSFEYAQWTDKIVIKRADSTCDVTARSWDSTDGSRRIWLSCGDYSSSIIAVFTSDTDRTVRSAFTDIDHYIRTGTEDLTFEIYMTLNNGLEYDVYSSDPGVTVGGYSKDAVGPQRIDVSYLGSQFSFILYSYNDSNTVPKQAHLVDLKKTYFTIDNVLQYTQKGVRYSDYAVWYMMCDGTERKTSLTEDMMEYKGTMDAQKRTSLTASISKTIEGYRYSQTVPVEYDDTEEVIKESLTIGNIIGDRTSANYSMVTEYGVCNISFGYRFGEFYIASDFKWMSSYVSSNLRYVHTDSDSFTLFLEKGYELDKSRSIIGSAKLTGYTVDSDWTKHAEFTATLTQEEADFFSGLGFTVGQKVLFFVTYDMTTGLTVAMDISNYGLRYISGTFSYDQGVVLSEEVDRYVRNSGNVSVIMTFDDGRDQHFYNVVAGTKVLKFVCDEDHGVYVRYGDAMVPFEMPESGITTSVEMFYLEN